MFSTAEQLIKRTGKNDTGRREYLEQLVNEFHATKSSDAKEQVLANLGNFAYDPINYEYLRQLKIIDLFLDQLSEKDTVLTEFAIGGLCNLSLDYENREYILHCNGIQIISSCLNSSNEETVISAITTLIFLGIDPGIISPELVKCMLQFSLSSNIRIKNLAVIFLEDCCAKEQVEACKAGNLLPVSLIKDIPLPNE